MTEDRRQRILQAALEVFLRYGYRRVTMDDIAQHVGMSRPALYLSFPGKEAIFRGVVEMGHDQLLREIEAGLAGQGSISAQLNHVFELWIVRSFQLVERSPAAAELMTSSFDFAKDLFEGASQRVANILAGLIRAAVPHPNALEPSAEVRARIMVAAAHGFKSAARDTQDLRALVHDLVAMTVAGLPIHAKAKQAGRPPREHKAVNRKGKKR